MQPPSQIGHNHTTVSSRATGLVPQAVRRSDPRSNAHAQRKNYNDDSPEAVFRPTTLRDHDDGTSVYDGVLQIGGLGLESVRT
jgi:hypothetical protein